MKYDKDKEFILENTDFEKNFLNRLLSKCPNFQKSFARSGAHNKMFFNDNGYQILLEASKLKAEGASTKELIELLENQAAQLKQNSNSKAKQYANLKETTYEATALIPYEMHAKAQQEHHREVIALHEKLAETTAKLAALEQDQKLLTDGETFSSVWKQRAEAQAQMEATKKSLEHHLSESNRAEKELRNEITLKSNEVLDTKKKLQIAEEKEANLSNNLSDLQTSLEKLNNIRKKEKVIAEKQSKIIELQKEIQKLSFFSGAKKKALREQITELESQLEQIDTQP